MDILEVNTRFEAARRHGFTEFTGRHGELARLHACLEKTVAGKGQFVTVTGEAGAGKSRLAYEFRHRLDRKNITVLQGPCQSYGSNIPYFPFLNALKRGLLLKEEDSTAELEKNSIEQALVEINLLNSRRKPMVLILEDWHWVDEASNSILKHLAGQMESYPLMVRYRREAPPCGKHHNIIKSDYYTPSSISMAR